MRGRRAGYKPGRPGLSSPSGEPTPPKSEVSKHTHTCICLPQREQKGDKARIHLQHEKGRIQASLSTEMAKLKAAILSPPAAGANIPHQAPLLGQGLIVREPQPLGGRALRTG